MIATTYSASNSWSGMRRAGAPLASAGTVRAAHHAAAALCLCVAMMAAAGLPSVAFAQGASEYNVFSADREAPPGSMLTNRLKQQAFEALDHRLEVYEALETPEQIAAYQKRLHDFFVAQLGGFPERTPLNARVVGGGTGQGFRYEKVLYDSQPGFTVSAVLYLPEGQGPFPAVLVPCGHSANGKASETYQRASMLLAMNGLAALCYDPIGQGERSQVLDPEGKPVYGSTVEHMMVGVGSILVGRNTATYRIWDGMRSLDYLQSRPDIDGKRLGCAGNSGGGTLSSYIMALDERVQVGAPNCYLTTFRRLLETIGPQDAEQNIYGQIAFGMDHPDYVLMRAPKPTLVCVATQDFFDIDGAWDNFRQGLRLYTRMGHFERVGIIETDQPHGFTTELRVGTVRWMRRWLMGIDDAVTEPEFPVFPDETLQCTPQGQVLRLEGQRTVYDFNAEEAERLIGERKALQQSASPDDIRQKIRELAGVSESDNLPEARSTEHGVIQRDGYSILKMVLETEEGTALPCLMFRLAEPKAPCLYLSDRGMAADAAEGGPIEKLVREGYSVMAVDLSGFGELATPPTRSKRYDDEFGALWYDYYTAYLLGQSMVGIRADEILLCAKHLRSVAREKIHLVAHGPTAVPALHALALEPDHFADAKLGEVPYGTWTDLVSEVAPGKHLLDAVHGALRVYDLPDLMTLAGLEK